MRDYGRVFASFWQSPDIRALPEDARTLAFYLLTTPHGNLIGCFRIPDAYAAEDLQWPIERVSEGFRKLCENGFVTRDEPTKWILITKFIKWNRFENPNVATAAHKAFDHVPDIAVKSLLAKAILEFGEHMKEGFRKGCETVAEPYRKPEPDPEPIQTTTRARTRARAKPQPISGGVADATPPATASRAVWDAYSEAYQGRYGVTPVRNASVNGQLAMFVGRLPHEEAPGVAAFYVRHQNGLYVAAMHPTNLMLRDAEKLRTEWATNRQVTRAEAHQADRTQTNANAFGSMIAEAKTRESADAKLNAA
jgi:hypothetical protein